jgi:hypothetical protein
LTAVERAARRECPTSVEVDRRLGSLRAQLERVAVATGQLEAQKVGEAPSPQRERKDLVELGEAPDPAALVVDAAAGMLREQ